MTYSFTLSHNEYWKLLPVIEKYYLASWDPDGDRVAIQTTNIRDAMYFFLVFY